MISTVDPDARHTRKSPEARRDGYRAHLAADPETGIITDEKLTQASGTAHSDPADGLSGNSVATATSRPFKWRFGRCSNGVASRHFRPGTIQGTANTARASRRTDSPCGKSP